MPNTDQQPWWHPDGYARRRPYLLARAAIIRAVRDWFASKDFVEVETPSLQRSPGQEVHMRAFETVLHEPFGDSGANSGANSGDAGRPFFLHTSPEFAMKKLLVAGEPRLFQITHAFRNAERGALHHPEFTMLEWYRSGGTTDDLMDDCEPILRAALAAAEKTHFARGEDRCAADAPFERLSVADAFSHYADIDILASADNPGTLRREASRVGLECAETDDWEDMFFRLMMDRIEPHLGQGRPTFLTRYPAALAALARIDPADPRLADRVELYVAGIELANGFGELTDATEQRARFVRDQARRKSLYGSALPVDEDFLAALEHGMSSCAGIALGIDRLVMLATGAKVIEDVLWAPVEF